jgi:PAS domain S-box-containing protein
MANILVVDDDPVARELVTAVLQFGGHRLQQASDGAEGLAVARRKKPELIISDLLMPKMDGFEFVRHLRNDPAFTRTPVVFYTASYLENEARRVASICGVSHFLSKPANPEQILELVKNLVGSEARIPAVPPLEEFYWEHLQLLTAKLTERAEKAAPCFNTMVHFGLELASERDCERLLRIFCSSARKILASKHSAVALLDPAVRKVRYVFVSNEETGLSDRYGSRDQLYPVLPGVMEDKSARRLGNLPGDPSVVGLPREFPPVHSYVSAPILSPDRVYGWVCVTEKEGGGGFSEEDEGLASLIAAQVGRVYENGTLYSEIKNHSDELEQELAERRRIEKALRESEERYRQLVEDARDVIFTLAPDQRIKSANSSFLTLTGWDRPGCFNRDFRPLIHREDRTTAQAIFQRVLDGSKPPPFELRLRDKSGRDVELEFTVTPQMCGGKIIGIVAIGRDVSERKSLEVQLRQAQKMESIGQLAGGVAHDFNNLLTVIQGHTDLVNANPGLPHPITESLGEISNAARRAAGLTRQLLTFSRKQVIEPRTLDLNETVSSTSKMLRRLLGENIELRFEPMSSPVLVHADPGMMEQVLMNLAVNARDAMPRGGTVAVRLGLEILSKADADKIPDAAPGRYVRLTVSDTGTGIAPEHLQKIFEPFFTTKEVGKGTGLGLATVFGIVRQHRGWISVESELNRGTTFKVCIPILKADESSSLQKVPDQMPQGGTETILVVEDEEPLRRVVRSALERFGYRVLVAETAVAALRTWHELKNGIDLVLTDVVMPDGLTGQDLAAILQAESPELPIILTTGYSDRVVNVTENLRFLWKPYDLQKLLGLIRQSLDQRTASPEVHELNQENR